MAISISSISNMINDDIFQNPYIDKEERQAGQPNIKECVNALKLKQISKQKPKTLKK